VFGLLLLKGSNRAIFSFRQIFVLGGRIECEGGIQLQATRIVQMTLVQFVLSLPRMQNAQPSLTPLKFNQFLTLTSQEQFYVNDDINHRFAEVRGTVTGLIWAAYCNDIPLVTLYIRAGADLDACTPYTALHWAVRQKHMELTTLLVEAGADVTCIQDDLKKYKLVEAMQDFSQILDKRKPESNSKVPHISHRPLYFTDKELLSFLDSNKTAAIRSIRKAIDEVTQALSLRTFLSPQEFESLRKILWCVYLGPYSSSVISALQKLSHQISQLNLDNR
jgi:hypothetical protein